MEQLQEQLEEKEQQLKAAKVWFVALRRYQQQSVAAKVVRHSFA
jgi:hypothetical protein